MYRVVIEFLATGQLYEWIYNTEEAARESIKHAPDSVRIVIIEKI